MASLRGLNPTRLLFAIRIFQHDLATIHADRPMASLLASKPGHHVGTGSPLQTFGPKPRGTRGVPQWTMTDGVRPLPALSFHDHPDVRLTGPVKQFLGMRRSHMDATM